MLLKDLLKSAEDCNLEAMIQQRLPTVLLSLFAAFLILGTSNHCAFEDLIASLSKSFFGAQTPDHLPNHLGSSSNHKHHDSSDSHEHGQYHSMAALNVGNRTVDFAKLAIVIAPLTFLLVFALGLSAPMKSLTAGSSFATGDPPGLSQRLVHSLILAPQAPPVYT